MPNGPVSAMGQCLTNRSTLPMSVILPEADTAAHDFMGFDPSLHLTIGSRREVSAVELCAG
jgi:hypothetical protein